MVVFLIIAIIEALIIGGMLFLYSKTKNRQRSVVDNAENIVKGNLNISDVSTNNLVGNDIILANGLNSIKSNLLTFVETTKQNVVVLSDAVEALNDSIRNNQEGNELIARNSMEVDEKTMEQLELVGENLKIIDANSEKMREMVESIDIITGMLHETVHVSERGMTYLEGYEKDMDVVSRDLNSINDVLGHFNDEIRNIAEVGDFIVGISNQLKLLSFNASIEAARAGQAGRGFAVVADEMTNMSEQTKEGMSKINTILSSVQKSSENVTVSINECAQRYNNSKETFERVNSSFRDINSKSVEVQDKIEQMADMVKVIADNSEFTKKMADDLYAGAQLINEKTGDMTAVSEEVAAEAIHIGNNTQALSGMLVGIQKLLKRFNTGTVPTDKDSAKRIKIAMFGMYDNDFWYGVKRGFNYAVTELSDRNVDLEFVAIVPQPDKTQEEFLCEVIMRLIKNGVDGIIYPGFLSGIDGLLKRAKDEGVKLMTYNCDVNNFMLRETCVASDSVAQGEVCATAALKLANSGEAVLLLGNPEVSGNTDRANGFRAALAKSSLKVSEEVIVADDGDDVYNKAMQLFSRKKPEIVYLTNGFPLAAAKALVDSGAKGTTKLIAHDLNPQLFPYVKSGVIGAVVSQDAFGQGHDPVVWMYNHIVTGDAYPSEFINCRVSIADASNIDDLIEA